MHSDVDECSTGDHACQDHSTCEDTEGGYNCDCNEGFRRDGNQRCIGKEWMRCGCEARECVKCVLSNSRIERLVIVK